MNDTNERCLKTSGAIIRLVSTLTFLVGIPPALQAATLQIDVQDGSGNPVSGFRWLVEVDNTDQPAPGALVSDSLSVGIHKSHAPVWEEGHTTGSSATVEVPDDAPVFVSVLPDAGYTMGGARATVGQASVAVTVNPYPIPTAQVSILVFHDIGPTNGAPEVPLPEEGLPGFTVIISDGAGQQMQNAFGHPLGTTYELDGNGDPILDPDGAPIVSVLGDGVITTNAVGQALVKYLPPGKFGVQIAPPTPMPGESEWIQTTTIEGTHTIDAWVKAGEPPVFVEFGPVGPHIFVGFIKASDRLAELPQGDGNTGSISGKVVYNHFEAPPTVQGFHSGAPVDECWVVLNDVKTRLSVYAAPCNPDSTFTITDIPAGDYELITFDQNLDALLGTTLFTMPTPNPADPGNPTWDVDFGDVHSFRWFGSLEGSVFYDIDEDGFRDPGEPGMPGEQVLLRFRDGTIYQATATDLLGEYSFSEVFPFFKWLVVEVGFARYKDTGFTNVVDQGGAIPPDAGWAMPSFDILNPQPQAEINPNTGNNLSRTESGGSPGDFLLQAMHLFLSQNNVIDFGKVNYGPNESGGISGIVFYAVTRAENDPRFAAGEPWEPGIPRVQINLYQDANHDAVIDDLDGDGAPTLADVDNDPLGWFADPTNTDAKGPEDVDRDGDGIFDAGDAIQITHTDGWDDSPPTGCIQTLPVIHGTPAPECFDNFGTWNQIRDGVFDGGYAIASYFPGGMANSLDGNGEFDPTLETEGLPPSPYIVEAATPKGYQTVKEEDKNVDYGDEYIPNPNPLALPPPCVGDMHTVPDFLSLFGDIEAPFAGDQRPLCDRKQVLHTYGQNTAAEFFMFTEVPKAARAVGFINNDLAAEFDPTSPVFGEKQAPKWVPVAFTDFAGNEITRVYCDEWGTYNALLPSTYSVNIAAPTGVSPHMLSFVINDPGPIPDPAHPGRTMTDPFFNPSYSQTPYTFNFESGRTTYLDTPVIPVAAFAGFPNRSLDIEAPDATPVLYSVIGNRATGPYVCTPEEGAGSADYPWANVTIRSLGLTQVPNPDFDPNVPGSEVVITRDYGFGTQPGVVTVGGSSNDIIIDAWADDVINMRIDVSEASTGRLLVTRGDNGLTTPLGVMLHVSDAEDCQKQEDKKRVMFVFPEGPWPAAPLQEAINTAKGKGRTLILVAPGTYRENILMYKNVKLQGSGAGATFINASPVPTERMTEWRSQVNKLIASGKLEPVNAEEGGAFFEATEAPGIFVNGKKKTFKDEDKPALIDGFTIWGSVAGGGIYVGRASHLSISSNKIVNNQGTYGGGITVGEPGLQVQGVDGGEDGHNQNVQIRHNTIALNGGILGGGGVTIYDFANDYTVSDNFIMGNFSRSSGGGLAHIGTSDNGTIERNRIMFNEVFYGAPIGGGGGGLYIGGPRPGIPQDPGAVALGVGTGSVTVNANLIQGNLAGSGSGGGIQLLRINGMDTDDGEDHWYAIDLTNNIIANNVAAYRGGAIAMRDAARVRIIHNTIADNESTATSVLAFSPGNLSVSNPQGGGIAGEPHTADLAANTGQTFSNPMLLNNIIWRNQTFHWDTDHLEPDGFSDLQVVGGVPTDMNPTNCILSDATGFDPSNMSADPTFVGPYANSLITAAVIDEGGNAISVRYLQVDPNQGDRHIVVGSPAQDHADTNVPGSLPLDTDFDGDPRPLGASPDIGADEMCATCTQNGDTPPNKSGSVASGTRERPQTMKSTARKSGMTPIKAASSNQKPERS